MRIVRRCVRYFDGIGRCGRGCDPLGHSVPRGSRLRRGSDGQRHVPRGRRRGPTRSVSRVVKPGACTASARTGLHHLAVVETAGALRIIYVMARWASPACVVTSQALVAVSNGLVAPAARRRASGSMALAALVRRRRVKLSHDATRRPRCGAHGPLGGSTRRRSCVCLRPLRLSAARRTPASRRPL